MPVSLQTSKSRVCIWINPQFDPIHLQDMSEDSGHPSRSSSCNFTILEMVFTAVDFAGFPMVSPSTKETDVDVVVNRNPHHWMVIQPLVSS